MIEIEVEIPIYLHSIPFHLWLCGTHVNQSCKWLSGWRSSDFPFLPSLAPNDSMGVPCSLLIEVVCH